MHYLKIRGDTRWRGWLRHCATIRKVARFVPDGVTGTFHWHNTSGRTMSLASTLPVRERGTRNIFWGGGGVKFCRCVRLTSFLPLCADCLEVWEPQLPGTLRAFPGMQTDFFYLGVELFLKEVHVEISVCSERRFILLVRCWTRMLFIKKRLLPWWCKYFTVERN
jgi:hypothetical protein